jgi:hypothetical protein
MLPTPVMIAPAIVILSLGLRQPSLMPLARRNHALAINETNRALESPQLATADSTLASVLLLALFEAVAFQRSTYPTSWNVHIDGAVELIKLRGRRQWASARDAQHRRGDRRREISWKVELEVGPRLSLARRDPNMTMRRPICDWIRIEGGVLLQIGNTHALTVIRIEPESHKQTGLSGCKTNNR